MTTSTQDPAEIFVVPLSLVDRDPKQPRFVENVDTDLAPSFKTHGWFEAEPMFLRVHPEKDGRFMLVNGERRLAGARAAGLTTGLAVLSTDPDLEASIGARLARQMLENAGKPLTYVEKAVAFAAILEERRTGADGRKPDPKYGPVQLAREYGFPKSTVSDALALLEIPACWRPLIEHGPLSPAHVPELRRWRAVPAKFQERALAQITADYRWVGGGGHAKGGDTVYVDVLKQLLRTFMTKFTKPVGEVPGYKGPTERLNLGYGGARTYAMDPSQWQPIYRKALSEKKKKADTAAKRAAKGGAPEKVTKDAWQIQEERRERQRARFEQAEPAICAAIGKGVLALPDAACRGKGALAAFLVEDAGEDDMQERVGAEVTPGTTAEELVRYLALQRILAQVAFHNAKALPKHLADLGLKVDVKKLLAEAPEQEPASEEEEEESDVDG